MEINSGSSSINKTARFAGLLYLIWIISGLFAMFYVPSQIKMMGDAQTISHNILSKEFLFRTSIINDLISSILWIFLVLLFYRMFKSVNERQAKLMFAFVIVQIPVVFIMGAFNITSLMILKGEILKSFEINQRQEIAKLFLIINNYAISILEMFWGIWLLPLAILVYNSIFLPRFLGVWLFVNGIAYLILSSINLLVPQYYDILFEFSFPAMLAEFALMLWLLIKGAKIQNLSDVFVQ